MDDESGESMELMEEVPLKELGVADDNYFHNARYNAVIATVSIRLSVRQTQVLHETTVALHVKVPTFVQQLARFRPT